MNFFLYYNAWKSIHAVIYMQLPINIHKLMD